MSVTICDYVTEWGRNVANFVKCEEDELNSRLMDGWKIPGQIAQILHQIWHELSCCRNGLLIAKSFSDFEAESWIDVYSLNGPPRALSSHGRIQEKLERNCEECKSWFDSPFNPLSHPTFPSLTLHPDVCIVLKYSAKSPAQICTHSSNGLSDPNLRLFEGRV